MGYSTTFTGHVTVTPPLNPHEVAYLKRFGGTRRMKRSNGPYYCGTGWWGQDHEPDIIDYSKAPDDQPGLWCQWLPSDDGARIEWDGGEKFYYAVDWMTYVIDTFLKPGARLDAQLRDGTAERAGWVLPDEFRHFTFDHVVDGVIHAEGEEDGDVWVLAVDANLVDIDIVDDEDDEDEDEDDEDD